MKAYIAVSLQNRIFLSAELAAIREVLLVHSIEPFVFVDQFNFTASEEREMMQQAIAAIDNSALLIAEVSQKGIGIGVEVGYAKAKNKPVIYLRNQAAPHSTTVSGISDFQLIYASAEDLKLQFEELLKAGLFS